MQTSTKSIQKQTGFALHTHTELQTHARTVTKSLHRIGLSAKYSLVVGGSKRQRDSLSMNCKGTATPTLFSICAFWFTKKCSTSGFG